LTIFGTGYSSLDDPFPVDRSKIAQQYMFDLTEGSGDTIVRAAIALAHEPRLSVIMEGAKTARQLQRVKSNGGREVQGYYFSKPIRGEAMTALGKGLIPVRYAVML
jgi:EAL domain-containing protein (putative c-di-GMP-specific phosphodiesterase class I)